MRPVLTHAPSPMEELLLNIYGQALEDIRVPLPRTAWPNPKYRDEFFRYRRRMQARRKDAELVIDEVHTACGDPPCVSIDVLCEGIAHALAARRRRDMARVPEGQLELIPG